MSNLADFSKDVNPNVRELQGPKGEKYVFSNLAVLLGVADREGFGIPACNVRSRFVLNAILEAAWQVHSPVILEIAEKYHQTIQSV